MLGISNGNNNYFGGIFHKVETNWESKEVEGKLEHTAFCRRNLSYASCFKLRKVIAAKPCAYLDFPWKGESKEVKGEDKIKQAQAAPARQKLVCESWFRSKKLWQEEQVADTLFLNKNKKKSKDLNDVTRADLFSIRKTSFRASTSGDRTLKSGL